MDIFCEHADRKIMLSASFVSDCFFFINGQKAGNRINLSTLSDKASAGC